MVEPWNQDKAPGDLSPSQPLEGRPQVTVQSKFLDAVRMKAENEYLQLIVHYETPTKGYAYIQERDSFVNLYAFHFEFGKSAAEIYPGTDKVTASPSENRRIVELSDGAKMEEVLKEILAGVEAASSTAHPPLKAFSKGQGTSLDKAPTAPDTFAPPTAPGGQQDAIDDLIQRSGARETQSKANVWAQDEATKPRFATQGYHPKSHRVRNVTAVVLVVVLVLLFVPFFSLESPTSNCTAGKCVYSPVYASSFTAHYYGVGAVLLSPGQGWNTSTFFGKATAPWGGSVEALGLGPYVIYF